MSNNEILFKHLPIISDNKKLNCPDCQIGMNAYRCVKKIVFKCYSCDGVWFGKDGFAEFKRTLDTINLDNIKKIYKPYTEKLSIEISSCPKCIEPLNEQNYSYKTDIIIRKCHRCKGFWLKAYDLLSLIELSMFSQSVKEPARELAGEVHKLQALKSKNKFLNSTSGNLNKYSSFFRLTPIVFLMIIITAISQLIFYIYRKIKTK